MQCGACHLFVSALRQTLCELLSGSECACVSERSSREKLV